MPRRRRENGTGWLSKRKDGRWQSALPGPDGKVAYFYSRTQAGALAKLEEAKRRQGLGVPATPPRQSYADLLSAWLATKKPTLEGSSYREYEAAIRNHLLPDLGAVSVAKLTPQHIQQLYNRLGERLAPATVRKLHNGVVYPSLDLAVRWGYAVRNVAAQVDLPKMVKPKRRALAKDEARRFVEAIMGDPLETLYLLAITTGMRQGELLGLRWSDLDLNTGVLAVRQQYKRGYEGRTMGTPKSGAGLRAISLAPFVVDSLRRHRATQVDKGQVLVFPNLAGEPLHPNSLRNDWFYPALESAGLPRFHFHELRHSAATILLAAGVPMPVVSRILGHSTIRMTVDLYGHIAVEDQAAATAAMGRLLGD